ncbi:MAG: Asp-tRNA(Asn)/Glu-tRNA(Gln) amidotransferase subunit GatC [Candidatus Gottesmanbacteria bacterium]|nr:Asp-tRNA(Asn)/Glu-tRNA(Gln) amidotransferase subunit GatC [Candidatus Gottesmanbacteria bacterium]
MSDLLSPTEIEHIAALAHLIITTDHYELFASQLSSILVFISKLQEVPIIDVAPTSQVTGLVNVYREDVVDQARVLSQTQALSNAHQKHNGFFVVPAVFES